MIICLFRFWQLTADGLGDDACIHLLLAAAFGGFLVFNHSPARIFMGDCGSLPAGFALAALALAGSPPAKTPAMTDFFSRTVTFAYPIFDMALVSILRKLAGRPISVGGRDHSSHRLASLVDERYAVWILWLLTAFGASLGLAIHRRPGALFTAVPLLALLLTSFGVFLATRPAYPLPESLRSWRRRLALPSVQPELPNA